MKVFFRLCMQQKHAQCPLRNEEDGESEYETSFYHKKKTDTKVYRLFLV